MASKKATINVDWEGVDFNNPKVQEIMGKAMTDIDKVYARARAELMRLAKEKRDLMDRIAARRDDEKIEAILRQLK